MTDSVPPNHLDGQPPQRLRIIRELSIAAIGLSVGLFVVPALIYLVGILLLGEYGGGPSIGSFYGDFFRNLATLTGRTWFLVLVPYLLLSILRLVFFRWSRSTAVESAQSAEKPTLRTGRHERREPFIAP